MTTTVDATPKPAPRKRGRPPGSKTNPAILAAAAAGKPGRAAMPADTLGRIIADAATPPEPEAKTGRPSSSDKLAKSLGLNYQALGGIIKAMSLAFGARGAAIEQVGAQIIESADECGRALAAWADTNPRVRKLLTDGSQFGALGMVLAAHAPIGGALVAAIRTSDDRPGIAGEHPTGQVDASPLTEALAGLGLISTP